MGNEKYLNYYIDTLVSTLTDCVVKNVSLQANAKISNDVLEEQSKKIIELEKVVDVLNNNVEQSKHIAETNQNELIQNLQSKIDEQQKNINNLKHIENEYNNVKSQITHLNTFRTELIKSREENARLKSEYEIVVNELNQKIEYLQLSPAKRKKIDTLNKVNVGTPQDVSTNDSRDGGTF